VAAQQVDPGPLEVVQRAGLGRGHEPERRIERSRLEARLGRGQRPLRPPCRIHGQRDRPLQERRRRSDPTTGLRPASRPLQLGRHRLTRSRRRLGKVPGPPIRVRLGIGRLGQGPMHRLAFLE
jgi:hypothetical protein